MKMKNLIKYKFLKIIFHILLLPLFSCFQIGCSVLEVLGPGVYIEPPENLTKESGKYDIVLRAEPAHYFQLSKEASKRPLNTSESSIYMEQKNIPIGGVNMTVNHGLVLSLTGWPVVFTKGGGYILRPGIKWQFFGGASDEESQMGWRSSLFAHYSYSSIYISGDQNGDFGNGGYPWKALGYFSGLDSGISVGYRSSRSLLSYFGVGYQGFGVRGRIKQEASITGDSPAAEYEIEETRGNSAAVSAGLFWGVNRLLQLNYTYSKTTWKQVTQDQHFIILGVQLNWFEKKLQPLQPLN